MIIGTAGHIDHGKTTLVQALTGVDTDRLPEERKRGISIDLGYAFMDAPGGGRLGFIDVPGHERLVHTMVAGASGIDYALLLVAADDGPMPQTREHLAVLTLLGIDRGAVVVTKSDRATPERVQAVQAEMTALLAGTALADVPMVTVSAHTGTGINELRALLFAAADEEQKTTVKQAEAQAFRLAIDRVFSLQGTGTLVTGTIHAGRVSIGDDVALVPPSGRGRLHRARVRSLHAQNQSVSQAHAGQRCAVALVGIDRDQIARGQWLVDPDVGLACHRLDARLTLWPGEAAPIKPGAHVQVHIGAARISGTVALLDMDLLPPGAIALAQLVLHAPVGAWHGQRLLLRDATANRTLAGGTVLDPFAPTRYRRTPRRLAELVALGKIDAAERLQALLAVAPHGVDLGLFAKAQGLSRPPKVPEAALLNADFALGEAQAQAIETAALGALRNFHDQHPDEPGPDSARLRRLAAPRLPQPLWQGLLAQLAGRQQLVQLGAVVHLPAHAVELSTSELRLMQKVTPALMEGRFQGVWARDLARHANEAEPLVRTTLARLARRGELHQIVKDLYYLPGTIEQLATIAREVGAEHDGDVLAGHFRDATGLGRKRAIQILEYFDRIGLTRRIGDIHRLRADSVLFA